MPQIKGLLLSGGQSQRMGTDKGLLCYGSPQTEIERWKAVFDDLALPMYWSQRPGQYPAELFPHVSRLLDANPGDGPLGAVMSAHHSDPEAAWLVLACDWPLLQGDDIRWLLASRRADRAVTCYVHEGRRQPLCCLYEPVFLRSAVAAWDAGQRSLDRLLQQADASEVSAREPGRFLNANDPAARQESLEFLRTGISRGHPHQSDR